MKTFGWDTVYIIGIDKVNSALAANKGHLLMDFDASFSLDQSISARGKFSAWEIVAGGSGKLLYLGLPIEEGTLTVNNGLFTEHSNEVNAHTVDLSGIKIIVSVELSLLPGYSPSGSNEEHESLCFEMNQVGSGPVGEGLVTPVNAIDPQGKLSAEDKAFILALIAEFLVSHSDKVSYTFATVNLIPPQTNSWLAPISSDYAYLDKAGASGYLAIMSVTDSREISHLERTIDPDAIVPGVSGSFLISRNMFLKNMIQPFLPAAYHTTPDSFYLDQPSEAIRNTHSFATQSIVAGAITYFPYIDGLAITTDAEGLSTQVNGSCSLYAGINMTFSIRTRNKAVYNPDDKKISFLPDTSPESTHHADIPFYFWFLGPIGELITELVVTLISDSIAASLAQLAGQALSIAQNPPQSIQWTDTMPLSVTSAGINESLFMMGQVN